MNAKNTVIQKIFNILSQEMLVEKKGENTHHKYKYATERDVLEAVRKHFIDQKLIYHFSTLSAEQVKEQVVRITYEFTLIDVESGDRFSSTVVADGHDSTDKGPYKAFTGAQKYFFMKLFMIATGDDPEVSEVEKETTSSPTAFKSNGFRMKTKPTASEPAQAESTTVNAGEAKGEVVDIDNGEKLKVARRFKANPTQGA